jgi:menaquinone-dependent protoporphyrinogen oxidase
MNQTNRQGRTAMGKFLVVFGTTEGQTRKIARFVADRLAANGHATTLAEAIGTGPDLDPRAFDAVLIAASLHSGEYQPAIVHFVTWRHAALNAMASAFVSVSLAAAGEDADDIEGLVKCVAALERQSGWRPGQIHHAAGAFRFTRYDFLKRWALKYIAYRKGQPTDTSKDYELTDWDRLGAFVDGFAARLSAGSTASPAE